MEKRQEPIRVAQIMGKWLGGGVEAVVMNYYRHIDRNKVQFDFICDEDSKYIPKEEIENLGGKVILIPPYQKPFKYHKELKRVLKDGNYKIVHSHISTMSFFSLWAAKSAKVPIRIAHAHSTTNKKEKKKNLMKQVLRPFSKVFANRYFCCSELAGRWLFGNKTYDQGKVYLLNNAIDLDTFKYDEKVRKEKRKELNLKDNQLVIGHLGRFVAQKNHTFLIEIFNEIQKKNSNTILLLAGQGPLQEQMKNKVNELGLNDKVRFLGQINDAYRLYQAIDIFILPSLYEGLPVVGVEAQATGLLCELSSNMTKETKVLDTTRFISLETSAEEWASIILDDYSTFKRHNTTDEVTKNNFNIKKEANKLEDKYDELLVKLGGKNYENKKVITITNAYTWYNKGDAGILLATIDALKKVYDNVEFNILSFTPDVDRKHYCEDKSIKEVYSNILNPHPYKKGKVGKTIAIIKLFFKMIFVQFGLTFFRSKTINKHENLRVLRDSDVIIVCGGGFLGGKKFDSLMHLYQMYIDTLFHKPVYVMGTSIEPIKNKLIKYYTDKVLKKVNFVFARESITEKYLLEVLDKDKHIQIPDMAFMLDDIKRSFDFVEKLRINNEKLFGITVRNWKFPNLENKREAMENYINSVKDFMVKEFEKRSCAFVFIPQVTVSTGDDTIVAEEIKIRLPKKYQNNFVIRRDDWSPGEIKSLIANMDYFVGTRMHSNIFATSMCVPTTAIAYEKKTNGIMETVGLENYITEISDITSNDLYNKVEDMIANEKKIRKQLSTKIKYIRKEILEKIEKVVK